MIHRKLNLLNISPYRLGVSLAASTLTLKTGVGDSTCDLDAFGKLGIF